MKIVELADCSCSDKQNFCLGICTTPEQDILDGCQIQNYPSSDCLSGWCTNADCIGISISGRKF